MRSPHRPRLAFLCGLAALLLLATGCDTHRSTSHARVTAAPAVDASPALDVEEPDVPVIEAPLRTIEGLDWFVVNDGVMGGRSQGDFQRDGGVIHFAGTTNTNGGGFSSIRTRDLSLDLGDYEGIRVRVRGDGRRYTWRLTTDARWRGRQVGFWADFETTDGEWVVADIPFSAFRAQWRGRMLDDIRLDTSTIRGMGLMIYDKLDGPFDVRLGSVEAYGSPTPFALSEEKWQSRVLVVAAGSADDERLEEQLADVEATRDDFADRDMRLVVLLDVPGSHVDGHALSADEAAAARDAAEIAPGAFAVRLIGKDGGVKRASSSPVRMDDMYSLIDSMPMRRAEMSDER